MARNSLGNHRTHLFQFKFQNKKRWLVIISSGRESWQWYTVSSKHIDNQTLEQRWIRRKKVWTFQTVESSSETEDRRAAVLFEAQRSKQMKKRWKLKAPLSKTRTSVWSTLSARGIKDGDLYKYWCTVCTFVGSLNRKISSSPIIEYYKSKHVSRARNKQIQTRIQILYPLCFWNDFYR